MTTPNEDQNQAPKPGSDEYNQAMADKFRSAKDTSQYPDLEDQEDNPILYPLLWRYLNISKLGVKKYELNAISRKNQVL